MRLFNELGTSEHVGALLPSADEICYWDAPTSELGVASGAPAAAAPAAPATEQADTNTDEQAATDAGDDQGDSDTEHAEAADATDDDGNADPLDALSSDDEDQDDPKATRTIEDRYKGLKQRARKLERAYKKHLPTIQALREAGVDLRTLISRSQKLADFERSLNDNPRLRALFLGENADDADSDRDTGRSGNRGRKQDDEPIEMPFDENDAIGRFLADHIRGTRTQTTDLVSRLERIEKTLGGRLDRIENGTRAERLANVQTQWRTATEAATAKLPKEYRSMFNDAVYGAMQQVLRGELRATPQQIIDHYLKQVRVSDGQRQRASDAAKQRTAVRNNTLPRRPSGGANGSPASPRSRVIPRLEDFNRDISRRFGSV